MHPDSQFIHSQPITFAINHFRNGKDTFNSADYAKNTPVFGTGYQQLTAVFRNLEEHAWPDDFFD
jgi:hypothetical protein